MKGFDFFLNSEVDRIYGSVERDRISQELKKEEGLFFYPLKQSLIQSAAGIDMLLERHNNADLAFITAFLTGTNDEAEIDRSPGPGKKYFRDGEVDSLGLIHKEGDEVSEDENHRRNKSLEDLLHGIGYNFVRVLGHYDTEEHSYCVLNYVEDTARFIDDMKGAAAIWNQDSVLIVPRKGYGEKGKRGLPFLYYPSEGKALYAMGTSPEEAIGKYYTLIGKDHISYPFDFSQDKVVAGLHPIRRGHEGVWVASNRQRLRDAFQVFGTYGRRSYQKAGEFASSVARSVVQGR